MRQGWVLGQSVLPIDLPFADVVELLNYDGPQMVLVRHKGERRLGVASDEVEDGSVVRWVFTKVSGVELRGLASGSALLRDAFDKPDLLVCDVEGYFELMSSWICDVSEVPVDALPSRQIPMPKSARFVLEQALPKRSINTASAKLSMAALKDPREAVPFRIVASILSCYQRFWTALGQYVEGGAGNSLGRLPAYVQEHAALGFAAASPGSLEIDVKPMDEIFHHSISDAMVKLLRSFEEPSSASFDLTTEAAARVMKRFKELLVSVEKQQVDLLYETSADVLFLSPSKASRLLRDSDSLEVIHETVIASGFFQTFSETEERFEFFDELREVSYRGYVGPDVLRQQSGVVVGQEASYGVMIESLTTRSAFNRNDTKYMLSSIVGRLDDAKP